MGPAPTSASRRVSSTSSHVASSSRSRESRASSPWPSALFERASRARSRTSRPCGGLGPLEAGQLVAGDSSAGDRLLDEHRTGRPATAAGPSTGTASPARPARRRPRRRHRPGAGQGGGTPAAPDEQRRHPGDEDDGDGREGEEGVLGGCHRTILSSRPRPPDRGQAPGQARAMPGLMRTRVRARLHVPARRSGPRPRELSGCPGRASRRREATWRGGPSTGSAGAACVRSEVPAPRGRWLVAGRDRRRRPCPEAPAVPRRGTCRPGGLRGGPLRRAAPLRGEQRRPLTQMRKSDDDDHGYRDTDTDKKSYKQSSHAQLIPRRDRRGPRRTRNL